MDNYEKARELLNKHLNIHGGDSLGITDGNIYRAVIDAIDEALRIHDVVGRSEQLPPNPITDKEHKDLMKALYPKDNSKRFRR